MVLDCYKRAVAQSRGPGWEGFRAELFSDCAYCHAKIGDFERAELWLGRAAGHAREASPRYARTGINPRRVDDAGGRSTLRQPRPPRCLVGLRLQPRQGQT